LVIPLYCPRRRPDILGKVRKPDEQRVFHMIIRIQEVGFKVQAVYTEGTRKGIVGIFSISCGTLNVT
jgi:hypothetical protein